MPDGSDDSTGGGHTGRAPVRGLVWIGLVVLLSVGALTAAWWFDRPVSVAREAPGQPEAFCNTVGRLYQDGQGGGVAGGDRSALVAVRNDLAALAAAEPPAQIRADLGGLVDALDAVIADAEGSATDDLPVATSAYGELQRRLRGLGAESDRVNDYTERWCGTPLNHAPPPG